jgi:hypothetical protein
MCIFEDETPTTYLPPLTLLRSDLQFDLRNIDELYIALNRMRKFPLLRRDEHGGLGYYHFPEGYPLYKATKRLDTDEVTRIY